MAFVAWEQPGNTRHVTTTTTANNPHTMRGHGVRGVGVFLLLAIILMASIHSAKAQEHEDEAEGGASEGIDEPIHT